MPRSRCRRGVYLVPLLAVMALASCATSAEETAEETKTDESLLSELHTQIKDGDDCATLFSTFEQIDESGLQFEAAQNEMRTVGCYMRDSERSDGGDPSSWTIDDSNSPWFEVHGEPVEISDACEDAAVLAASESDSAKADPLISATFYDCTTADEWMTALETYPGILALTKPYTPIVLDLQSVCFGDNLESPVCKDAANAGVDVGP